MNMESNKKIIEKAAILRHLIIMNIFYLLQGCFAEVYGTSSDEMHESIQKNVSPGAYDLVKKAMADIEPGSLCDYHVHIIGLDKKDGQTWVNPRMFSWLHPFERFKTLSFMKSSGIGDLDKADPHYVGRLVQLIRSFEGHGKLHILALDYYHNPDGTKDLAKSEFYTSNSYIYELSQTYPDIFVPAVSIHPYRKDALEVLEKWGKKGVRFVKWLPNAQGINAADPRIDPYYSIMKKYNMVLLTHAGMEMAVKSRSDQRLGNPLLFRRPLDMGVKVIMAHCASLGRDKDLDNPGKKAKSFDLFLRLMDDPKYEGLLFGEISGITQFNRMPGPVMTLLERQDLHHRLINGSDYPLPAINIVIQTRSLVKHGLITKEERKLLNEIYKYNPILFDFVVKRTIRKPGTGEMLPANVFIKNGGP